MDDGPSAAVAAATQWDGDHDQVCVCIHRPIIIHVSSPGHSRNRLTGLKLGVPRDTQTHARHDDTGHLYYMDAVTRVVRKKKQYFVVDGKKLAITSRVDRPWCERRNGSTMA